MKKQQQVTKRGPGRPRKQAAKISNKKVDTTILVDLNQLVYLPENHSKYPGFMARITSVGINSDICVLEVINVKGEFGTKAKVVCKYAELTKIYK